MNIIRNLICLAILFVFSYILLAETPILNSYYFKEEKEEKQVINKGDKSEEFCLEEETIPKNNSANPPSTFVFYPALQITGTIGATSRNTIDNPSDNIFHIELDKTPHPNSEVWLTYELKGLADHQSVCRIINDQLAMGGYLIKKSDAISQQEERLHPFWLKKGTNTIRFSLPQPAPFHYQIKNLGLKIEEKTADEAISNQKQLIINQPFEASYYNDMAYLKGLIMGEGHEKASVLVGGKKALVANGAFEIIIPKPDNVDGLIWSTDVVVKYPDGTHLKKYVQFLNPSNADYGYPMVSEIAHTAKTFAKNQPNEINLEGLSIQIDSGTLQKTQLLSVTELRAIDLPTLNAGMVNVTKYAAGFRPLPQGTHFQKNARIRLAYDKEKIPAGFSEKDIRSFYYNKAAQQWEMLHRDSIDLVKGEIISIANQLGDMINGVIQVPESPTTQAYTPTSIKDIKAAAPNAEIVEIQPPTANNMGYANLSYPIKIPAGRNGMQPQVVLEYSSGADNNSWCGMGWNLSMPAIMIDTRWGVPRFNPSLETETYLLNGQQLSPVAHRDDLVARSGNMKTFHPRVEGSFQKIIRHGTNPKNYWWEVVDKEGTRYFHGRTPEIDFEETKAILRDTFNNIAHWALVEVRDLNQNFVKYHYKVQRDVGVKYLRTQPLSSLETIADIGKQIYVTKITYTGHGGTEGKYSIHFLRDRNVDTTTTWHAREDITISGRNGFKQVTADLLDSIEVKLNDQPIRTYKLEYKEGALYKTLLEKITEHNAAGTPFTSHTFDYHDDVRSDSDSLRYEPYQPSKNLETGEGTQDGDFVTSKVGFKDHSTSINGAKSNSNSVGAAITIGPCCKDANNKGVSGGGDFNSARSTSRGLLELVDINGDGRADKVYINESDELVYRPNIKTYDTNINDIDHLYGEEKPIGGLNKYFENKSKTTSFGFQFNGPKEQVSGFIGYNRSKTKNATTVYFSDVNGDQLVDIIINGVVYFNRLDENRNPLFIADNAAATPSHIEEGASIDANLFSINQEAADLIANAENPPHDIIKVWQAPFDGNIVIDAPVQLIEDTSTDREAYTKADGVRVSIQKGADTLWTKDIDANNYEWHTPDGIDTNPMEIAQGEKVYFRVETKRDGAYDQVDWNPIIEYKTTITDTNGQIVDDLDANGLSIYKYSAEEDFLLTGPFTTTTPIDGTITIQGQFIKPTLSDNITIQVVRSREDAEDSVIFERFYQHNTDIDTLIDTSGIEVLANDIFTFKINAQTNVDWTKIQWKPLLFYTASSDTSYQNLDFIATDTLDNGTIRMDTLLKFHPVVDYSIYAEPLKYAASFKDPSGQVFIKPILNIEPDFIANTIEPTYITFSIKRNGSLIQDINNKITFTIENNNIVASSNQEVTVTLSPNEPIYFDYHTSDRALAAAVLSCEANVRTLGFNGTSFPASLYTTPEPDSLKYGPLYRHWGQFVYKGTLNDDFSPIKENLLKLDDNLTEIGDNVPDIPAEGMTQEEVEIAGENSYNPANSQFIPLLPLADINAYRGYDDLTYISNSTYSSSRLGDDDPVLTSPIPSGSGAISIRAIEKRSESIGNSFSLGASVGNLFNVSNLAGTGSFSYTFGRTQVFTDFLDMNGDRYPDIIGQGKIQHTRANGGLENFNVGISLLDVLHHTKNDAFGFSLSGAYVKNNSQKDNNVKKITFRAGDGTNSAGLNGSVAFGYDTTQDKDKWFSLIDINGDGLPDKVFAGGNVALNYGYYFGRKEQWDFKGIKNGSNTSKSAGLGISIVNGSIQAGVGLSSSDNNTNYSLFDINGDGLIDRVFDNDSLFQDSPLTVHLNTGNGFTTKSIEWNDAFVIMESTSNSESANAGFTGCILIPAAGIRICINPTVSLGQNVNREHTSIQDIDGDDFPDYLKSDEDNNISVALSTIARTNKLKTVHRPLGASFTLDYQRVGNTYDMPNSVWTLSSVKMFDGFAGDGADTLFTTFEYADGQYDRHEREFYGFKTIKTNQHDTENNDAVYRSNIQTFINDNYYEKGLLVRDTLQDGSGNLYTETINSYKLLDVETGLEVISNFRERDNGAAFPALVQETQKFYEGLATAGKSTHKTYNYDRFGNVIQYTDAGELGVNTDNLNATISYHNNLNKYIVGIPDTITVRGGTNNQIYRKRFNKIDSMANVIEIHQMPEMDSIATYNLDYYSNGNLKTLTRPTNSKGDRLSFEYEYDGEVGIFPTKVSDSYGYSSTAVYDYGFGQVLESRDMNNQPTTYELDAVGRIVKVTGSYEFDETNAEVFTIKFDYFPDTDVPWALTQHFDPEHPDDPIETVTFIDGLGRVLQVKKDGTIYNGQEDEEKMIVSGRVLFDAFGRATTSYYPIVENLENQGVFNDTLDDIQPTRTSYDVLDRTISVMLPDSAITQMSYSFDSLGNFNDAMFLTRIEDANGTAKESFTDVRGRVVATKDTDNSPIWATFEYNPINELIAAKDHDNNAIISEYDWLGRRTKRIHPDADTCTYKYDLANNLIEKQTANIRAINRDSVIRYHYDRERLSDIVYPFNPQNNVNYTYGDTSIVEDRAANRLGRIKTQSDATGQQQFFYGPLGEITKNIRLINIASGVGRTYTTRWNYDTWNRVQEIVYPDGELLTYDYNKGGKLASLSGSKVEIDYDYVTKVGYDKFEDRVFMAYGNGTHSTYSYEDRRRRLQNMQTYTPEFGGRTIMDCTYEYDAVTNITGIKNMADMPTSYQLGGPTEYIFKYDGHYRLDSARGLWTHHRGHSSYSLDMGYNQVHDITSKTQIHQLHWNDRPNVDSGEGSYDLQYKYENANQPHTATNIGFRPYHYDLNGNLTQIQGIGWILPSQHLKWDEEDRLMETYEDTDANRPNRYVYDADDIRTYKYKNLLQQVFENGEMMAESDDIGFDYTVYVNPYMVITGGRFTKHIFIEGQRIASKLGVIGEGQPDGNWGNWDQWDTWNEWDNWANREDWNEWDEWAYWYSDANWLNPLEDLQYYFHSDHLGSSTYITDFHGFVHQHLEYFPFGDIFLEQHKTNNGFNPYLTPYLFNGKEMDEETGWYYYGARYLMPRESRWLSVDPMAEKYPEWSGYNYTLNNPVVYVDPDGEMPLIPIIIIGMKIYDAYDTAKETHKAYQEGGVVGAGKSLATNAAISLVGGKVLKGIASVGKRGLNKVAKKIKYRNSPHVRGAKAENYLQKLYGGERKFFKINGTTRQIDNFIDGVAQESKVGRVSKSKFVKSQIDKDVSLLLEGKVRKVEWRFFKSKVTGKGGYTDEFADYVKKANKKLEKAGKPPIELIYESKKSF